MTRLNELSASEARRYLETLIWVSQVFWGPDRETLGDLFDPAVPGELEEMAHILENRNLSAGASAARSLADWARAHPGAEDMAADMEEAFVRLFVSHREGVAAPLYQSCYQGEGLMMGPPALRMQRRLEEAGLALEQDGNQPPDHLAAELEYLFVLLENGLEQDGPDMLEQAAGFVDQEMLTWLPEFTSRLAAAAEAGIYPDAARLATDLASLASGELA